MADKKECDRCKAQALFGTLKGWAVVEIRDMGDRGQDQERARTRAEVCPPCRAAVADELTNGVRDRA